jgi:hypothetical protein
MAAVTSVISAGVALAGVGMSAYQLSESQKTKKNAQQDATNALNNYSNLKEQDVFSGLQVPTMGSELQQQSADRATAQALQMVSGTPEMAIGATPGLVQANMEQTRQIGADLDQMKYQRDYAQTQNRARIEQGRVGRQEEVINAQLSNAQMAAQQADINKQMGIKGMFAGATNTLNAVDKLVALYPDKKTTTATDTQNGTYNTVAGPKNYNALGDNNNNGIPDYLQPNNYGNYFGDNNNNGIPDYLQQ